METALGFLPGDQEHFRWDLGTRPVNTWVGGRSNPVSGPQVSGTLMLTILLGKCHLQSLLTYSLWPEGSPGGARIEMEEVLTGGGGKSCHSSQTPTHAAPGTSTVQRAGFTQNPGL